MIWLIYLLYVLFGTALSFCGISVTQHPIQFLLLMGLFMACDIISRLQGYRKGYGSILKIGKK